MPFREVLVEGRREGREYGGCCPKGHVDGAQQNFVNLINNCSSYSSVFEIVGDTLKGHINSLDILFIDVRWTTIVQGGQ